jgi:hypothetical protein
VQVACPLALHLESLPWQTPALSSLKITCHWQSDPVLDKDMHRDSELPGQRESLPTHSPICELAAVVVDVTPPSIVVETGSIDELTLLATGLLLVETIWVEPPLLPVLFVPFPPGLLGTRLVVLMLLVWLAVVASAELVVLGLEAVTVVVTITSALVLE